ncbi:MAG: ATPase V [Prevotellaceae bacterium]|nr:ATPase V [Prevotellaceae bacterium]
MKKLTFLIYHKEYEQFLEQIRELGVVHIVEKQQGEPDQALQALLQKRTLYKSTLHGMQTAFQRSSDKYQMDVAPRERSAEEIVNEYEEMLQKVQQLNQQLAQCDKDIAQLTPWGNFDWDAIRKLEAAGWKINFYTCSERDYEAALDKEPNIIRIEEQSGLVYFITLTRQTPALEMEPVRLPSLSLSELEAQKVALSDEYEQTHAYGFSFCHYYDKVLEADNQQLQSEINLREVELSGERMADGTVLFLEGWVPVDKEAAVRELLDRNGVYYEIRPAVKGDNAPIKLRNNAFTRMYEVLVKMYGMPDYSELDPTPLVAPFFTLFFAFCVGDAGYGLILIALGFLMKKKMSASMRGMMNLVITLGCATTVLGALFGTFFGISLLDVSWPWMQDAKKYMISSDHLMYLSLAIGVVHILIGMTVKAITATLRYGFLHALSEWGWLLLVAGFVATGGLMYLQQITPEVGKWAFIVIGSIAAVGIFLLNNIRRNVLVNIGAGLWDTYNMATGLLGDTLSYIRLYALGLAGAMLGMVFNQLAFMINIQVEALPILGSLLTWVCCGLILVFGHALNIAMSCLSGFVHPLRLTFVEYFKNSGYEGKGEAYKPFSH